MERDNGIINEKYFNKLKTSNIIDTNNNLILEQKIADYTNRKYCLSTCNGTSAILLGMISLGLKEHDEVIIPGFSYHAVYTCAKFLKLGIKFCDISAETLCMDPDKLKDKITSDTKAVFFINHLGYVGEDLIKIKNICNGIPLFEDSAQGLGQFYNGVSAGAFGKIGIYSFSGTKLLRCGEGGCLVTDSEDIYNSVKKLRDMGIGNYTLSPMSAKLIELQLDDIDEILETRNNIQKMYLEHLGIYHPGNYTHAVCYLSDKANQIHSILKGKKIETRYNFYMSMDGLDNTLNISKDTKYKYIELPQYSTISADEIRVVCDEIKVIESLNINPSLLDKINKMRKPC